jgi:uncharacterized damage-inducible protein DinB
MSTQQMSQVSGEAGSPKARFLDAYEREHATTMRVLRAFPAERAELRPHPKCRTARELAWVFVMERGLGTAVFNDELEKLMSSGPSPNAPESWEAILEAIEGSHRQFGDLIASTPEPRLKEKVRFFTGPGQLGEISRIDLLWFLLSDEIHHRGQFSIYLRMAEGPVPSIYGPSGDEPWM